MSIDATELFPRVIHEDLAWLGSAPGKWCEMVPGKRPEGDDRPRTDMKLNLNVLESHPGADRHQRLIRQMRQMFLDGHLISLAYLEAGSRLIGDGPKLFRPTEEQWESLEQVEMHLPMGQFQTPYPAMMVSIPTTCRQRLMQRFGVPSERMPKQIIVRFRHHPGENSFLFVAARFGPTEMFHIIQDQEGNEDIEEGLARQIRDSNVRDNLPMSERNWNQDYPCSHVMSRVALNCCLLLTHQGFRLGGPLDPVAWKKHRTKKHLTHFKFGDYQTVQMVQEIVVRAPSQPTTNPEGPGTGIELKPHWRKGHWRCYPGCAAKRAAGEKVPLLFVRPCVVRMDRTVGPLSASETTISGK